MACLGSRLAGGPAHAPVSRCVLQEYQACMPYQVSACQYSERKCLNATRRQHQASRQVGHNGVFLLPPRCCTWLVSNVSIPADVSQARTSDAALRLAAGCKPQMHAAHRVSILGDLGHPTHPRAWIGLTAVGHLTELSNLHSYITQGRQRQNNEARRAVLCDMVNYMLTCRALSSSPNSTGRSRGDTFSLSTVSFSPLSYTTSTLWPVLETTFAGQ
jgi:hypothetical protein